MNRIRHTAIPLLMAALGLAGQAFGQGNCQNTSQHPNNAIIPNTNGTLTVISTCNFQLDYSEVVVLAGLSYQFTASDNTYITVREGTFNGPVVGQGFSSVEVTATASGSLFPQWNVDDLCTTESICITTGVQQLLNCDIPEVTVTYTEDCVAGTFMILLDIASTGDGASVDIVYVNAGNTETMTGVGTGITELGPFTLGSQPTVNIQHESDPDCNIDLGILAPFSTCTIPVICGDPAITQSYCYDVEDDVSWTYTSDASGGVGIMRLRFNQGTIESSTYDNLVIYDGPDNTAPILFVHNNQSTSNLGPVGSGAGTAGNFFYGVEVYATGNSLYMEMSSDNSVQCSNYPNWDQWEWEVVCLDCSIPVATMSAVDVCDDQQFTIPVVITDTGSGATVDINYTVNGGAVQTVAGVGVGTEVLGPFSFNDIVNVIISHANNALCDVELGDISDTRTCPLYIACGTEVSELLCYTNNSDSRYYYQGTGTFPLAVFFDAGSVFFGDSVKIFDGGDITAPLLFAGDNDGDMTDVYVYSTNPEHQITIQVTANNFTDCATGFESVPLAWRVSCLNCVPPTTTFELVQDCENSQYFMEVTVTTMGTDPTIDVTNSAGAPALQITAPGTYSVGPIVSGTPVEVVLENDMNNLCNVSSGVRLNPVCPIPVCGSTIVNDSFCYGAFASTQWAYEVPTAGTLRLTFIRGTIESNTYDNLIIYDGADETAPVLFMHGDVTANLGPDGSAVTATDVTLYETVDVTSTGTNLYMVMYSDGSVQCNTSTTYDPWEWQVYCEGCVAPGVSYNITTDCTDRSFGTEVIVTSAPPSEGLQITNTITNETQVVNSSAVYNFGPYDQNTDAVFEVIALNEPGCVYRSDTLTVSSTECMIVGCGYETTTYCYGNDEDRWYTYKSALPVPTTISFISGQLLPGDRVVLYNGPDENSPVLYTGNNGGNLSGFALNSQNADNTITLRIQSDASGSCTDASAGSSPMTWFAGCGAVGVEEEAAESFSIFPNPTNGLLTINIGSTDLTEAFVTVIDMQGRAVVEQRISPKAGALNTIDLSGLAIGQYQVRVMTNSWIRTQQVQIAR